MSEPEYKEPKLITLKSLQENVHIPDDIKEMVIERYVSLRNQMSGIVGELELSYRRGYDAGVQSSNRTTELNEYKRLCSLFVDKSCENESCKFMSVVDMMCPPCQVRFQLKTIEKIRSEK